MTARGMVAIESIDGFAETARRLDALLEDHGIVPVLRVDHAAAAAEVGLTLRPISLILFANPRVGTCLMQENPTAGIDLPVKLLLWEDEHGAARVGYNDPAWIERRHALTKAKVMSVKMASILQQLALGAAGVDR